MSLWKRPGFSTVGVQVLCAEINLTNYILYPHPNPMLFLLFLSFSLCYSIPICRTLFTANLTFCGDVFNSTGTGTYDSVIESTDGISEDTEASLSFQRLDILLSTNIQCTLKPVSPHLPTCEDCLATYKHWVCSALLPPCGASIDQISTQEELCPFVDRRCPTVFDFACPES